MTEQLAVITPIKDEPPEVVMRCVNSVARQTVPVALHVLIFDGTPCEPSLKHQLASNIHVIELPAGCEDTGATPRAIGTIYAQSMHCDGVAYLDADNSWAPSHLESTLAIFKMGAHIVVADRWICNYRTDKPMFIDQTENGISVIDTNTLSLFGDAILAGANWWRVPRRKGVRTAGVDRYLEKELAELATTKGLKLGRTHEATVFYRSRWIDHYRNIPMTEMPDKVKILVEENGIVVAKWAKPIIDQITGASTLKIIENRG
ncbi:MAG: glycosyltransferase [Pseudomonadales bacterium]